MFWNAVIILQLCCVLCISLSCIVLYCICICLYAHGPLWLYALIKYQVYIERTRCIQFYTPTKDWRKSSGCFPPLYTHEVWGIKLRSEIVWHRFFAVPALIRRFRSYIAVRKLFLNTSPNFSSRFRGSACFWQSPDILRKIRKFVNALTD